MTNPPKKAKKGKPEEAPAMPFDEALKRVWSAPPKPKQSKKRADKKSAK